MPDDTEIVETEFRLAGLFPSSWGWLDGKCSIWLACYRIFLVPLEELVHHRPLTFDVFDCRLIVMFGKPNFLDPGVMEVMAWQGKPPIEIRASQVNQRTAPDGAYLMIATHYPAEPEGADEATARRRVNSTVALCRTLFGHNVAYDLLFENILGPNGERRAMTAPISQPAFFGVPHMTADSLVDTQQIADKIDGNPHQSNRIRLALRWLDKGFTNGGVDGFIQIWISLETLGMSNENIRPLNESLAKAYGITYQEACDRFLLGRLTSLRGAIVHNGLQPPINALLLSYMRAVFVDILHNLLDERVPMCAGQVLETESGTLADALARAMAG